MHPCAVTLGVTNYNPQSPGIPKRRNHSSTTRIVIHKLLTAAVVTSCEQSDSKPITVFDLEAMDYWYLPTPKCTVTLHTCDYE